MKYQVIRNGIAGAVYEELTERIIDHHAGAVIIEADSPHENGEQVSPSVDHLNNGTNAVRRALYRERVDPLIAEARLKEYEGLTADAAVLLDQAATERADIQTAWKWV